jgi:hypothetical protein
VAGTCLELILAVNRCLHFTSGRLSRLLFGRRGDRGGAWKPWAWTVPPVLMFFVLLVFCPSCPYSSVGKFLNFDPHFGYVNETEWFPHYSRHPLQTAFNWSVSVEKKVQNKSKL